MNNQTTMENKPDMPDVIYAVNINGEIKTSPMKMRHFTLTTYTRAPAERDGVDVEAIRKRLDEHMVECHNYAKSGAWLALNWLNQQGYLQPQPRVEPDDYYSAECIHGIHPDQCITCTPQSGDDAKADTIYLLKEDARLDQFRKKPDEEDMNLYSMYSAPAKPDLSALIAEVAEEVRRDEPAYGDKWTEADEAHENAVQTLAEKLTAALKDKGV